MKSAATILLTLFLTVSTHTQGHRGSIVGTVVHASTREQLVGINVTVVDRPGIGVATDANGRFLIESLDVGTYSLKISAVGFEPVIVTNIVVSTGRQTPVAVKLNESPVQSEEVLVRADYFGRGQQVSPLSASTLERSEIRRAPGGLQDIQRVVQSLPGVASSTDNINELIVRGGAPFENLTVIDGMEVPSINHYSNQYNSAGPTSMLNADMISDVQFLSGGFPAQYGDKASSVMNITVREGNRGVGFSSNTGFHMAGYGTLMEGGFAGGKGSFIVSARQSLLQLIDKIMGMSVFSLTAVPKYWDAHGKLVYDLSLNQRVKLNVLYGESRINIEGDPNESDDARVNMTDSTNVQRISTFNRQLLMGMNWQTLWGKKGYSMLTLYGVSSTYRVNVHNDYTRFVRGASGEPLQHELLATMPFFENESGEAYVAAKYEVVYQPHPRHDIGAGLQVQTVKGWDDRAMLAADTSRYDLNRDGIYETGPILVPKGDIHVRFRFGQGSKYFFYVSDNMRITPELHLILGGRYDHFTYTGMGKVSLRSSLSYAIRPPTTTVSLAVGVFPQTQPFPYYADRRNLGYNHNLDDMIADHIVLGFDHVMDEGLKLSVEAYAKRYRKIAISEDFIYSAVDTFWSDRMRAIGTRTSYGVEFFLEKKQVSDWFGTVSLSLSKAEDGDPRIPPQTESYRSAYDYPYIITILGGKIVRGVRDWLDQTPFFIKYPSYILPFSNEVEFSFKYRFQSGRPYTPSEYVTWKQSREGGLGWSRGAWIQTNRINAARYPDYSRLDLQWISRFDLEKWNFNIYLAMQNILDTKNVFYEDLRSDGTKETVYQFRFFPVLGFEAEF
jgi:outer membrane receptor protein involved in Fe transport